MEKASACQLSEVFLLNLPGAIDQLVPAFLELGYNLIADAETTLLKVCAQEVVINTIYYNPRLAIQILESKGWTSNFFTTWFQNIDSFTRVHDLKLCILALCKLFQLPFEEIPIVIQAGYHQAMVIIVKLFQALPAAYECNPSSSFVPYSLTFLDEPVLLFSVLFFPSCTDRKKLEDLEDEDDDEEDDEEIFEEVEGEENADEDVFNEEDEAYMNMLREKAQKEREEEDFFGDDLDLEEELEQTTPLDDVNEYIAFQETLRGVQASNPATFAALTKGLNQTQGQFLHQLSSMADQKRIELQQQQQQQQQ